MAFLGGGGAALGDEAAQVSVDFEEFVIHTFARDLLDFAPLLAKLGVVFLTQRWDFPLTNSAHKRRRRQLFGQNCVQMLLQTHMSGFIITGSEERVFLLFGHLDGCFAACLVIWLN